MLRVEDELRIHDQHVGIARQAIQAARIKYTSGKVPQQDILKAQVALTRLAEHMIRYEPGRRSGAGSPQHPPCARPDSPLRVIGEHAVLAVLPDAKTLDDQALQSRPDLIAAERAADRSHKAQALAKKAYVPDFTVSAGYMLMPTGQNMRNAYMLEGTMNLPWLNHRKHDAEIAEATVQATEQDAEADRPSQCRIRPDSGSACRSRGSTKARAPLPRSAPAPGRSHAAIERNCIRERQDRTSRSCSIVRCRLSTSTFPGLQQSPISTRALPISNSPPADLSPPALRTTCPILMLPSPPHQR